ncbi:HAD family hydrolase [Aureibaculum sp. 2210JD6-5]|uniref:HAD family hydrolase n=1 Tax=Aureibaculum sp. 2210JD6-5 TaxID=3103957 RepID=UPI002AACC19B|nr:HAD family hydrolase [Aureibaculum sp. 2210JD6-5]MDY7393790.1 HAD family hydrolase [Aureibaculum sp. 2210JD6-5]
MKYKCIIFDCDGVLVDSEAISTQIMVDLLKTVDYHIDIGTAIDLFTGLALKDNFKLVEKELGRTLPEDFEATYRKLSFEAFQRDLQPIKGVHELLDKLTIPYCVASSGPLNKIKLNLKITNLLKYFDNNIFSCYEINSWKPEPDIFLYAAETMGFKSNECVVIEDSLPGVIAAKAGGFDVYALQNESNKTTLQGVEVPIFTEMSELMQILRT